jgi:ribosome recycling factor
MPVSQPTVESRNALVAALQKQAEETRIAIRKVHQASQKKIKALGFDAKSAAMTDVGCLSCDLTCTDETPSFFPQLPS